MPDRNEYRQFSLKFLSANQTTMKKELRFKSFENDVCFSVFGARARETHTHTHTRARDRPLVIIVVFLSGISYKDLNIHESNKKNR